MSSYNRERIERELTTLANRAQNTTAKGRRLQDLAEYLLEGVDGLKVVGRNVLNGPRSEEKDLWVRHRPDLSGLPFADVLFPVECKNEDERTSAAQIRDFELKIRDSGGHDGLLVTAKGLSGEPSGRAHHAITMALSQGIRITVITAADLSDLRAPSDLVDLLIDRFTELRVVQGYRTI
ncbi:hypothetical protein [Micromonospora sp. DPT]|uniref:hypothetical protein n=1 Tax=Micromonospora sp. DPT TaxID=3142975 RepID=UPI003208324B